MNIPKHLNQSIVILLAGISVILIFALIFILPSNRALTKLDAEIGVAKFKIDTQEKLGPLYKSLTEKLKKIDNKAVLPNIRPIARDQLGSFNSTIGNMAEKAKLKVLSVYPETSSAEGGSSTYNANLRGNFSDFRIFLKELGTLPYLESVQDIRILTVSGNREFNIKIKLLVSG